MRAMINLFGILMLATACTSREAPAPSPAQNVNPQQQTARIEATKPAPVRVQQPSIKEKSDKEARTCMQEFMTFCPNAADQIQCLDRVQQRLSPDCKTMMMNGKKQGEEASAACRADTLRFCRAATTLEAIVTCLAANRKQISPACQLQLAQIEGAQFSK